ncbi:hypothetical protein BDN72DRAFT_833511 [Pluteus cervinus]|uniref:Uncharacterized protein n=1 Tax=Pluteus cervinus TaxID=181527 RepID=A0ACD3B7X4_9AGAR|nr:hypothetical protein BDN72DRAFT_833511 [Pluteus cervinus]
MTRSSTRAQVASTTLAGLQDLPNEILHKILSDPILTDELFNLSTLTRHLNSFIIDQYFTHHRIRDPTESLQVDVRDMPRLAPFPKHGKGKDKALRIRSLEYTDTLSALAIAFDLKSIDNLTCVLFPYVSTTSNQHKRFIRILNRLTHVKSIRIIFDPTGAFVDKCLWLRTYLWRDIMSDLLNISVEKGCEELYVESRGYCYNSTPYLRLAKPKPPFKLLGKVLSPKTSAGPELAVTPYRYRGDPKLQPIPLSDVARNRTRLKHLQISSILLLRPPYSYWTYSILDAASSLTSLELSGFSDVSKEREIWRVTLPWLFLPLQSKLVRLTVENILGLPARQLFDSIIELKNLEELKLIGLSTLEEDAYVAGLVRDQQEHRQSSSHPEEFLPNLTSLYGHSEWINLLCPEGMTVRREKLRKLYIQPKLTSSTRRSIISCLEDVFSNSTFSSGAKEPQLEIILDIASTKEYCTRDFYKDREWAQLKAGEASTSVDLNWIVDPFRGVTGLSVRFEEPESFWSMGACHKLSEFLEYWKGMRCVEFVFVNDVATRDADNLKTGSNWRTGNGWKQEDDVIVRRLINNAKLTSPSLKRFVVGEREWDI